MYVIHFLANDNHNVIYLSYKIIKGDNTMFKEISAKELKENPFKLIGDDFTVDEDINRDSKKVILNHLVDKINKGGIEILYTCNNNIKYKK